MNRMTICATLGSKTNGTHIIRVIFKMTLMMMMIKMVIILTIIIMRNDITCTINCNYRTAATLYTLVTWFVQVYPM
jgi:hypothetical protein